ncbi:MULTISPECIES: aldo/keto reductase [unclassified Frondihabitans]|uniref:aldo/keto reductase n=1 Tax=unclassified Frondihabitans TaxID=2626248 RepID=UPI000F4E20D0|nr:MULTISPECIES: aldo/keto reductase [unclassified Frondihabitans]RPE76439.1 L-glyceraldehyde 3-phosphate reductase [Frondihabitans sp. PhB153]RPF05285.1 L-glyceraldehyde 3-phosphate reductase [Frondihabitans sp. PhB161]
MTSPFTPYVADAERYEKLPYDRIGRSGLRLPRISLGFWNNFGTDRSLETQRDIVLRAFDRGVTHFDLANNYGPPYGSAEEQFGRILSANLAPYRDEILISSKAGYDMWPGPYGDGGSRKYLLSSLDQSLTRMGLDYVDIFYSHRPDPETPIEETMGALATAVRQGKALYVGISNYDPAQTEAAITALAAEGVPLLIHQPRYNMFDRRPEQGLFDTLTANGVGSIVFSPLAGGLLTGRYLNGKAPSGSRAAEGRWFTEDVLDETYLSRVGALNDIASARGQSLAQLALLWVLRQEAVTSALIGASSVAQLDDSLDALHGADLSDAELAAIEPLAVDGTGSGR